MNIFGKHNPYVGECSEEEKRRDWKGPFKLHNYERTVGLNFKHFSIH
jgi:hypothetical protein